MAEPDAFVQIHQAATEIQQLLTGIVIEGIELLSIGGRDLLAVQNAFSNLAPACLDLLFMAANRIQELELPFILTIEFKLGHGPLLDQGTHAFADAVIDAIFLAHGTQVTELLFKADQAALTLLFGKFHAQGRLASFYRPFPPFRSSCQDRARQSQLPSQEPGLLLPKLLHRLQILALLLQNMVIEVQKQLPRLDQLSLFNKHLLHPPAEGGVDGTNAPDWTQLAIGIDGCVNAGQGAIDHPKAREANQTPDNRPTPAPGAAGQGGAALAIPAGPMACLGRLGRRRGEQRRTGPMTIPTRSSSSIHGATPGSSATGIGGAGVLPASDPLERPC